MDINKAIEIIAGQDYPSITDLRYNQKLGHLLSKNEFLNFLKIKDELISKQENLFISIPLKTFNSKYMFYVNGPFLKYYKNEYIRILLADYESNQSNLFNRNIDDIIKSHLFSEIEGSLNIENVPTTHKRIAELYEKENLTEQNDIIIRNMFDAIRFIINEKPEFNKENLFNLYSILSKNCLTPDLKIKPGNYYRDDQVFIATHEGAPVSEIDNCMNSLFNFVNNTKPAKELEDILPHICHYYILYVHPYFDFNGRTARMVAFWLSYIRNTTAAPIFISEAINETKHEYYSALEDTRNSNNDLTYFLGYIFKTSIKYSFIYKNLEEIKHNFNQNGDSLTNAELLYIKKILVHNANGYFNYKQFLKYINSTMSKQGALKLLNTLAKYKILKKSKNKKGETIFKFNDTMLTYVYSD